MDGTAYTPRKPSAASVARSVLPYAWPADNRGMRLRVALGLISLVLAKVTLVLAPTALSAAVNLQRDGTAAAEGAVVGLIAAATGLRLASSLLQNLRDDLFGQVQQDLVGRLSGETFDKIMAQSLAFHHDHAAAHLGQTINRGCSAIVRLLQGVLLSIAPTLLELALVISALLLLFPYDFTLILLTAIAAYLTFTWTFSAWRGRLVRTMIDGERKAQAFITDCLLNVEAIKHFSGRPAAVSRYRNLQTACAERARGARRTLAIMDIVQATIIAVTSLSVLVLAAHQVLRGQMELGAFVLINAYVTQLYQPLARIGGAFRDIGSNVVEVGALMELHETPADPHGAMTSTGNRPAVATPAPPPPNTSGGVAVAFEAVAFSYDGKRPILENLTFDVPAGSKLAVVGPTGSGKSTLTRLLFRFYTPSHGRILLDGHDIAALPEDDAAQQLGIVPQDTVLFNDTIGFNIALGRAGATRAEIEAAATRAELHDLVKRMPSGYDTLVGERGVKLSGGEKQRVAIARMLLKQAPILILDEATSALDPTTERDILRALRGVSAGRTSLAIAHRLSTIVDADRIIVLQGGRADETGTHFDLLAKGGAYARMWSQSGGQLQVGLPAAQTMEADWARPLFGDVQQFLSAQDEWAIGPEVVERATYAVAQITETIADHARLSGSIHVEAAFHTFALDVRLTYDGAPLHIPTVGPALESVSDTPGWTAAMGGFLVRGLADRIRTNRHGATCTVDLHFHV